MQNLKIFDIKSICGNMSTTLYLNNPLPELKIIKQIFEVDVNQFEPIHDSLMQEVANVSGHEIFLAEDQQYYYLSHITVLEDLFITYKYLVKYHLPDFVEPHKSMLSSSTVFVLDAVNVLVKHEVIDTTKKQSIKKPKSFELLLEDHEKLIIAPFVIGRLKKNSNYKRLNMNEIKKNQIERNRLYKEKKENHEELLSLYKKANEIFDGSILVNHLADNVFYNVSSSADVIKGKIAVSRYLILRIKFWKQMQMGGITRYYEKGYYGKLDPMPCLILNSSMNPESIIFFTINENDLIEEIHINDVQPQIELIRKVDSFDYEAIH